MCHEYSKTGDEYWKTKSHLHDEHPNAAFKRQQRQSCRLNTTIDSDDAKKGKYYCQNHKWRQQHYIRWKKISRASIKLF